ncbi:MAG TPA: hypothetical protein VJ846_09040 [Sphingomicrobium sp.]|nr:hypothetical protein [Sphingomicrobium sp.]
MAREVATMAASIPNSELAIQWDVCLELVGYDGGYALHSSRRAPGADRSSVALVPKDAEIGVHLATVTPVTSTSWSHRMPDPASHSRTQSRRNSRAR